ncbi:unnamed protein product [Orchesella dallaii]|uniref:Uncharacterized protein n=1 Tax=Orchesella dallaii TaxID=48710 RepID=A0ABP1PTH7_9HEXA
MHMDSQQTHQSLDLDEDMQEFNESCESCESPIRPSTPSPVVSPIALRIYVPDAPVLKHQKLVPDTPVATKFQHIFCVSTEPRLKTNILREYKTIGRTNEKPLTSLGKNAVWAGTTLEQFYDNGENVYRFEEEKITAKGCTVFTNSDEIVVKIFQLADTMKSIHEASVLLEEHKIAKKQWDKERRVFARTNKVPEARCPPDPMEAHFVYNFTLYFLEYFRYMRDMEQLKLINILGLNKHD